MYKEDIFFSIPKCKKKDWNQSRLPNSISLIFQTKKTKLKFWKIVDLTISRLIIDQRLKENAPWTLKKNFNPIFAASPCFDHQTWLL